MTPTTIAATPSRISNDFVFNIQKTFGLEVFKKSDLNSEAFESIDLKVSTSSTLNVTMKNN